MSVCNHGEPRNCSECRAKHVLALYEAEPKPKKKRVRRSKKNKKVRK